VPHSISLTKEISVDGGLTYQTAPEPGPGPTLVAPMNPLYRYVVQNTGTEPLFLVTVEDPELGPPFFVAPEMGPGEIITTEPPREGHFAVGLNCNSATVIGHELPFEISPVVTDTDTACYTGSLETCSIIAYQPVCIDADITVDPTVTIGEVEVVCTTVPSVHPFGTRDCPPSPTVCGFTVHAMLCVAVPVSFAATAMVDPSTEVVCYPASEISCFPGAIIPAPGV
jgi:hypothetical protein